MIQEIAFTAYRVTDIERARKFYQEKLGLTPAMEFGGVWIEYGIGEATFVVQNVSPEPPGGSRGMVAFEVDDFDATVAGLKASETPFTMETMETGVCWTAIVTDPDGNPVCIHKRKAAATP